MSDVTNREVVCYCFDLSRDEITALIRGGCRTLEALQAAAYISTRCQSCRIDVEMIIDTECANGA